jgi:hypothetical protein
MVDWLSYHRHRVQQWPLSPKTAFSGIAETDKSMTLRAKISLLSLRWALWPAAADFYRIRFMPVTTLSHGAAALATGETG